MIRRGASSLDVAAARMRARALEAIDGERIGSEDEMIGLLGFSRPTVRQAARVLEREGLIRVRRGAGGGYLAARPEIDTIERTVSAYMESHAVDAEQITSVSSVLWIHAVDRAARSATGRREVVACSLHERVGALSPTAPWQDAIAVETAVRTAILALIDAPYIEMIFQISETFARRRMLLIDDAASIDPALVADWRSAKLLELDAIARGDAEIAVIVARRARAVLLQFVVTGMPAADRPHATAQAPEQEMSPCN